MRPGWEWIDEDWPRKVVERQEKDLGDGGVLPNGYFTLTLPDGSYRTFRVHTKKDTAKFAAGKRVISILIGPENTTDYEGFGFVTDDGIQVWKRFKGTKQERYAGIIWELANGWDAPGCELEVSKRCLVCNRPLTTPESLARGLGPECWERRHG